MAHYKALASWLAPAALLASVPLLALGWFLPVMTVTSFWVLSADHSVFGGLIQFISDGEWLLAFAVGGFAVIFPLAKALVGLWAWARPTAAAPALQLAHGLSKWSMLDVFVIALVVMTAKSSIVADASLGPGAWCFAAAALASTLALKGMTRRLDH